jgi:hypothetical protein
MLCYKERFHSDGTDRRDRDLQRLFRCVKAIAICLCHIIAVKQPGVVESTHCTRTFPETSSNPGAPTTYTHHQSLDGIELVQCGACSVIVG